MGAEKAVILMAASSSVGGRRGDSDDVVLKCVDGVLKEIFGEPAAAAIYDYLEQCCHLKRENIVEESDVFMKGLERLLGSGANVVKKVIVENLRSSLGDGQQPEVNATE